MSAEKPVEPYYMRRATEFIDCLFDKGYFHADVKREDMRSLDEYLGFLLSTTADSAVKCALLTRNVSERTTP